MGSFNYFLDLDVVVKLDVIEYEIMESEFDNDIVFMILNVVM